jgi:hypothetical protein
MPTRALAAAAVLLVLSAGLSACSEQPQRLESAAEPGYRTDEWRDQLRRRTMNQNESTRIGQ